MRVLIAAIRKNGYKVARTGSSKGGGSHQKILRPNGSQVTDDNGPLILSGSPSEHRWREMHVHRLMKAGVLKADPWKATGQDGAEPEENGNGRKRGAHLQDPEVIERRQRALQERTDKLRGTSAQLRARLEPIIAKLGGWSRGGSGVSQVDFVKVVLHWLDAYEQRAALWPKTKDGVGEVDVEELRRAVTNLRQPDKTVGEKWTMLLRGFIDELQREAGVPPDPAEAALKYLELLRETKGLVSPRTNGAGPGSLIPQPEPARPLDGLTALREGGPVLLTSLALEVLVGMARGAGEGPEERARVIGVAVAVAELELEQTRRQ